MQVWAAGINLTFCRKSGHGDVRVFASQICTGCGRQTWPAHAHGHSGLDPTFPRSPALDGAGNGTSAHLLRKSAPAAGDPLGFTKPRGDLVESAVPMSSVLGGAGNGTSAYLLRKSAPAAVAYRRPCLLAINASRLFNARTLAGSSPGTLLKKARHRDGAVLVLFTGAGNGTRTRECQLGKLMPYHLAMPACVLASITRLSCSIQGCRCLF